MALFFATTLGLQGQTPQLMSEEDLAKLGRSILEAPTFAERDSANSIFKQTLLNLVATDSGMALPLEKVTNMLRLEGPKQRFAIYTWQMPNEQYVYQRFGVIAIKTKRGVKVHQLVDKLDELPMVDFKICKPEEWPGAIYYQLIPLKGEDELYTLLGFASGEGKATHQKIIELIEVKENGRVRFGAKKFKVDQFMDKTLRQAPMRLILKYSSKYTASVRWNEKEKMIVMDHLAPPQANMKGLYQYYGPDFTYDALRWEYGWWELHESVRFNTNQEIIIAPPQEREPPQR